MATSHIIVLQSMLVEVSTDITDFGVIRFVNCSNVVL